MLLATPGRSGQAWIHRGTASDAFCVLTRAAAEAYAGTYESARANCSGLPTHSVCSAARMGVGAVEMAAECLFYRNLVRASVDVVFDERMHPVITRLEDSPWDSPGGGGSRVALQGRTRHGREELPALMAAPSAQALGACEFKLSPNASLTGAGKAWEYYHFLIDFLPRIFQATRRCRNAHILVPAREDHAFLVAHPSHTAMDHTLTLVLSTSVRIDEADEATLLRSGAELIPFPATRFPVGVNIENDSALYQELRQRVLLELLPDSERPLSTERLHVVLIQRSIPLGSLRGWATGSARRHLPPRFFQEAREHAHARRYHLSVVKLEKMGFLEQVWAFSAAHVVIGLHGAGLANILWCKPRLEGTAGRASSTWRPRWA